MKVGQSTLGSMVGFKSTHTDGKFPDDKVSISASAAMSVFKRALRREVEERASKIRHA
jgi:hypothetical protein